MALQARATYLRTVNEYMVSNAVPGNVVLLVNLGTWPKVAGSETAAK